MKIKPVVIIIPLLIALPGILGGFTLVWQLLIFYLLVLLFGYLWALINIRGIDIGMKEPPSYSRAGDWFEEEITVSNDSRIPRFGITVKGLSDLPGYDNSLSLNLPSENTRTWQERIHCRRRGLYTVGASELSVPDPFGLITLKRIFGTPRSLTVFPEILPLPFFEPDSYKGYEYGVGRWLRSGTSSTIGQVREYSSGDTLNHVHWPSTAHTGSLMVKVFEPDQMRHRSRNVWLVLDMEREAQAGSGEASTGEYIVTIASSVFDKYTGTGKETGMVVSGDRRHIVTPGSGDEFGYRVGEILARIQAFGKEPVASLISEESARFERDSVVIVITPSTDERMVDVIRDLTWRGCLVVVILLDPAGFGGSPGTPGLARDLSVAGAQVYPVRNGDYLARVLDSRHISSPLMYGD